MSTKAQRAEDDRIAREQYARELFTDTVNVTTDVGIGIPVTLQELRQLAREGRVSVRLDDIGRKA